MDGIELHGVTKAFGGRAALTDVAFRVPAGQVTGFVGSNGAGKSTAMRIVLGLLDPDAGTVTLDGTPIDTRRRGRFGYMPEEQGLYPEMTVLDHLVYLARLQGASRRAAREEVERWGAALHLSERFGSAIRELSLGNRQRVQLIAALLGDPTALVLDEPFSGLDPTGVDTMGGVLAEVARAGRPILFSSHQLDLMERVCDRVVIVHAGRIVAEDRVDVMLEGTDGLHVVSLAAPAPAERVSATGVEVVAPGRHAPEGPVDLTTHLVRILPGDEPEAFRRLVSGLDVVGLRRARATLTELYRDQVVPDEVVPDAA